MLNNIDAEWTEGTHIIFRNLGTMNGSRPPFRKTNLYNVLTRDSFLLGHVRWFSKWRKYAFDPIIEERTFYEETCLRDIADFCERETKAHRAKTKVAKA